MKEIANLQKVSYAYVLDPEKPPISFIKQSEIITIRTQNAFGDDFETEDELEISLSTGLHHPLTGPLFVEGIESGDRIEVEILNIIPAKRGYQCASKSSGILRGFFEGRNFKIAEVDNETVTYQNIKFPVDYTIGVIGTANKNKTRSGRTDSTGGNLDIKGLSIGSKLFLNCEYDGGLIYLGDVHLLQGAGEISGVALESGAEISLQVRKSALQHNFPIIFLPEKVCIIGYGETIELSLENSVENALEFMSNELKFSKKDAYSMLGVIGDITLGHSTGKIKTSGVCINNEYLVEIIKQRGISVNFELCMKKVR